MNRKSKQHKKVCEVLRQTFLRINVCEEYAIRWNGKTFLLDIYVPQFKIAFEVQGEQHDKYIPFIHKSLDRFARLKRHDVEKAQACIANNIRLIYIYPHDNVCHNFILSLIQGEDHGRECREI